VVSILVVTIEELDCPCWCFNSQSGFWINAWRSWRSIHDRQSSRWDH